MHFLYDRANAICKQGDQSIKQPFSGKSAFFFYVDQQNGNQQKNYPDKCKQSQAFIPEHNSKQKRIINEKEAITLVKAIGPIESALKPVCMEMQSDIPYKAPKTIV